VPVAGFDGRCFRVFFALGLRASQHARDERPLFCEIVAELNVPQDDCDSQGSFSM
jgi:hypothetical protein